MKYSLLFILLLLFKSFMIGSVESVLSGITKKYKRQVKYLNRKYKQIDIESSINKNYDDEYKKTENIHQQITEVPTIINNNDIPSENIPESRTEVQNIITKNDIASDYFINSIPSLNPNMNTETDYKNIKFKKFGIDPLIEGGNSDHTSKISSNPQVVYKTISRNYEKEEEQPKFLETVPNNDKIGQEIAFSSNQVEYDSMNYRKAVVIGEKENPKKELIYIGREEKNKRNITIQNNNHSKDILNAYKNLINASLTQANKSSENKAAIYKTNDTVDNDFILNKFSIQLADIIKTTIKEAIHTNITKGNIFENILEQKESMIESLIKTTLLQVNSFENLKSFINTPINDPNKNNKIIDEKYFNKTSSDQAKIISINNIQNKIFINNTKEMYQSGGNNSIFNDENKNIDKKFSNSLNKTENKSKRTKVTIEKIFGEKDTAIKNLLGNLDINTNKIVTLKNELINRQDDKVNPQKNIENKILSKKFNKTINILKLSKNRNTTLKQTLKTNKLSPTNLRNKTINPHQNRQYSDYQKMYHNKSNTYYEEHKLIKNIYKNPQFKGKYNNSSTNSDYSKLNSLSILTNFTNSTMHQQNIILLEHQIDTKERSVSRKRKNITQRINKESKKLMMKTLEKIQIQNKTMQIFNLSTSIDNVLSIVKSKDNSLIKTKNNNTVSTSNWQNKISDQPNKIDESNIKNFKFAPRNTKNLITEMENQILSHIHVPRENHSSNTKEKSAHEKSLQQQNPNITNDNQVLDKLIKENTEKLKELKEKFLKINFKSPEESQESKDKNIGKNNTVDVDSSSVIFDILNS